MFHNSNNNNINHVHPILIRESFEPDCVVEARGRRWYMQVDGDVIFIRNQSGFWQAISSRQY